MMSLNPSAVPFTPLSFGVAASDSDQERARRRIDTVLTDPKITLQVTGAKLEQIVSASAPASVVKIETALPDLGERLGKAGDDQNELEFEDLFNHDEAAEDTRTPRAKDAWAGPSLTAAPTKSSETPDIGAVFLESPRIPHATCEFGTGSSGSSSVDEEAGIISPGKLGPNNFELLRVVGQGAFGKVFQVRRKDTSEIFAMKVMRKERILAKDHGDYVRAEREVLTAVFHPYIVTLRCSFQTSSKLYLVLDFVNGGHLFFQLYRAGVFDEPLARLYTAELVLAIAHLHSLGIAHRDLKPENVLLDSEGHIKVTDFGLAKPGMDHNSRTNSFIGTMEYMAPEIVGGKGHGKVVDWWSVGILLYEMLTGMPPFRAKGRAALQKQIMSQKIKFPPYMSTEAQSLLRALLQREAPKRLGYGANGSEDVKQHPFFKGVNWDRVMRREIPSPFTPSVKHVDSVENFDKIWTDLAPEDSPCGTPPKDLDPMSFQGFTYCAPSYLEQVAASTLGKDR